MLKLTKINCRSIVHSYLMLTNGPYCKVLPNNLYIVSIMSRWTEATYCRLTWISIHVKMH